MNLFDKIAPFHNMSQLTPIVVVLVSVALSLIGLGGAVVGGDVGGIIVIILIVLIGLGGTFFEKDIREGTMIVLGKKQARLSQMEQGLKAIQEADPTFNLAEFCGRVAEAVVAVNQSLDQGELDRIRAFASDGIYERIAFRHQEEAALGRRRETLRLQITDVRPVEIHSAKNQQNAFEVISLQIRGSATRAYHLEQDGSRATTEEAEPISEVWTFLRRRGARTKAKDFGLIDGKCPNCGTDVTVNQWEKCPSCDSVLRSGEHDWVLSKISEKDAWKTPRACKMSSATRYWIKQDPGFNAHYLADRASVVFFRKVLADRLGVIDPLGKVASDRFCEAYEKVLQSRSGGQRTVYVEPKILAADVCGMIAEEPFDRALMHLRWSARRGTIRPGQPPKLEACPVQMGTMMVLARKHGTKTRIERTITSSHCPKCGAPESNHVSHACEFCGTVLNDGMLEWTMFDILPYTSSHALALRKKAHQGLETEVAVVRRSEFEESPGERVVVMEQNLPEFSRSEVSGVEINGAALNVAVREDDTLLCKLVAEVGQRLPIARADLKEFLRGTARALSIPTAALRAELRSRTPVPKQRLRDVNPYVVKRWLTGLIDAAFMDGKIEPWQHLLIQGVADELGLARYDVEQLIRVRTADWEEWTEGMRTADFFPWVVALAAADGKFDGQEVKYLQRLGQRYDISPQQLREMCDAALLDALDLPVPSEASIGQFWLVRMIDAAFADGKVCAQEQRLLGNVGQQFGLTAYDVRQLIRRRRAALYKQAKENLRGKNLAYDGPLHLQAGWQQE